MRATITGLDTVVSGLESFGLDVREAAFYGVVEALQAAFKACYTIISESDHSLRDLALLGHPYSAAHGFSIHDPDVIVHVQQGGEYLPGMYAGGEYRDALRAISPRGSGGDIVEGQIVNDSELDRWIQEGTTAMRARPWMQWIVDNYGQSFADIIIASITRAVAAHGAA